jgi:PIN domain nuclease of toxin-antitoxin system
MRLLLDTHIALWAVTDDARLSPRARDLIGNPENDVFVSTASVWEIAIKHALARGGPNDMPVSGAEALQYFLEAGYALIEIFPADAAAVETLPTLHADPFDRLLIAQALQYGLPIATVDADVAAYPVSRLPMA